LLVLDLVEAQFGLIGVEKRYILVRVSDFDARDRVYDMGYSPHPERFGHLG